ncbi:Adaptive-response sensory-kinase SasA [bioreactor metagenome]|uniref:histidine kinase n=1 Tax=bioreactor metagenome TaxID=1076179 RepID=A0A645E2A3_9ZZZZ
MATPIQSNGVIVGAVLLHEPVESASKATWQGVGALAAALPVALVLAVLLSGFLAVSFTRPLSRMNASALRLSAGDYTAKTEVRQKDEIGTLANSIDQLSDRLLAAQAESEKLEELRRSFVANISHELKTPVTVIRGSLEALCDGVVTDPEQMQNYHRQMLKESLFLQRLISDLLDLSKLQNTEFKIEMQPLNLCDIVSDAVRSAEHLAQKKEIELQLQLDVPALPITGDYGRLRQMLLIVLDNAIKFSPPHSSVELALSNRVVSVTDHGKGIAADELPHIFDRFYKANSADNQTGSGLGLAIAKQIAERHGVKVDVASTAGVGSRFTFAF